MYYATFEANFPVPLGKIYCRLEKFFSVLLEMLFSRLAASVLIGSENPNCCRIAGGLVWGKLLAAGRDSVPDRVLIWGNAESRLFRLRINYFSALGFCSFFKAIS